MRVSARVTAVLFALLLVGAAWPAAAASRGERRAGVSVRVTQLAGGARLHVHISGVLDRVFWSKDQIASATLADVDDDGDLDLLAATEREGLLVWRNTARGFELAHGASPGPRRTASRPGMRATRNTNDVAALSDDSRDPADLTPGLSAIVVVLTSAAPRLVAPFASAACRPLHQGRAPPAIV